MSLSANNFRYFNLSLIIWVLFFCMGACNFKEEDLSKVNAHKQDIERKLQSIFDNEDSLKIYLQRGKDEKEDITVMLCNKLLGVRMRENSKFSDAIIYHREGLDIALKLKDTIEIVQALNNLGTDFRRIGALSEASDYHYKALDYSEAYSKPDSSVAMKNTMISMNGIGNVSLSLEYYSDAQKYFREALKREAMIGSDLGQAINYANLGAIFEKQNLYDSAWVYYELSLRHNQLAGSDMGIGLCYIHFGRIYETKKEYAKAKEEYMKAYSMMSGKSDKWHWLEACVSIARIGLFTKETDTFEKYINLAEQTAKEIESPEHLGDIYELKHLYALQQKDYKNALDYFKYSSSMRDSIVGIQEFNRYMDLRVNYERSKNLNQIKEIEQRNAENHQRKQRTLYAAWAFVAIGAFLTSILYYAYQQRTNSNRLLKTLEKNRSEFFTNITHEFRTPLTVILGLNEEMQRRENLPEEDKRNYMEAIQRQGNNLLTLVNRLLDMARLKSGNFHPNWEHGDIISYVRMATESFSLYAIHKKINIKFESDLPSLYMDFIPFCIDKILDNLVSNAIKHCATGDRIILSVSKEQQKLFIRVIDTGEGIPYEEQQKIFELFYQSSSLVNNTGSGIGLAFVQMLTKKMNGKISVESEPGKGSTFTVSIPIRRSAEHLQPVVFHPGPKKYSELIQTTALSSSFEDKKVSQKVSKKNFTNEKELPLILLVEDNKDVLIYIHSLLSKRYNVITAQDGGKAIQLAEKHVPDLVVTDVMMPIKDGYQLCDELKNNLLLNHIPILILTARSTEEDKIEGLRHRVDGYIHKPFRAEELLLRIENILENRQAIKEKYLHLITNSNNTSPKISNNTTKTQTYAKEKEDDPDPIKENNIAFIQKITSIIYSEIKNQELTVSSIAEKLGISAIQLNRKLNAVTGYNTESYILQVRISKAGKMLHTPNTSIVQVAEACGFHDVASFSKTFKEETGMLPSEYIQSSLL